jgi:nucleotide-binding universal stress UspA family protein
VVGVDGSEHSNVAVRWAADEAALRNVPLRLVHIIPNPPGDGASGRQPDCADPDRALQRLADDRRRHGALRRGLLGSVSTALIHHALGPVAVIHDEAAPPDVTSRLPVLVGIDGSPASELATAIAFDEASWRGVDLVACTPGVTPIASTTSSVRNGR